MPEIQHKSRFLNKDGLYYCERINIAYYSKWQVNSDWLTFFLDDIINILFVLPGFILACNTNISRANEFLMHKLLLKRLWNMLLK